MTEIKGGWVADLVITDVDAPEEATGRSGKRFVAGTRRVFRVEYPDDGRVDETTGISHPAEREDAIRQAKRFARESEGWGRTTFGSFDLPAADWTVKGTQSIALASPDGLLFGFINVAYDEWVDDGV